MIMFDPSQQRFGFLRAQYASIEFTRKLFGPDAYFCHGLLAHYTDLNGMVGILESGGFWLSDMRFLNDVEEFNHGRSLARNLINQVLKSRRNRFFAKVLEEAAELLDRPILKPYYVASFSRDPDSLEQWRAYAVGGDGVALVFENEFGATIGTSHFAVEPLMYPLTVVYDDQKKKLVVLNAIKMFTMEFQKDRAAGENIFTATPSLWADHLVSTLSHEFLAFKDHAFKSENEIRIVVHHVNVDRVGGIRHRVKGGMVIPFLCSAALYDKEFRKFTGTGQLPLREIIVGPNAKQSATIESIRVFLSNLGYINVQVRPSRVPFRG